jgi:type I restriction enzyme, S subunit
MVEWEIKPLGEVCTIKPPKTEARAKLANGDEVSFAPMEDLGIGVKYLHPHRTRQLGEVSGSYTYFADGDVLLAKITPCFENGKLGVARALTNGVGFGSSEYIVLRPASALDAEFLYYYLARPTFLEEGARTMTGAVGHKRVAKEFVESYLIPLPPLPEQRRIVAILDEAFEGIATAKANAEKNMRNARELLASRTQFLFGQDETWERVQLTELLGRGWITSHLDGNHGSDYPRKEEFVDAGVPYIAASAIKGGTVDFEEAKYLSPQRAASIRKGLAKDRDVLFAHNATVGPVAILSTDEDVVILGTSLTYYRCDPQHIHPEYLAHFMLSPTFTSQYAQIMKQSTRNQVPITKQREFFHVIPPISVQRRIADDLDELSTQTERLADIEAQKLVAFNELKRALLHQAFSGALKVKTIDEQPLAET